MHEIPARSKLEPRIPITSPQFVYRRARDTDVRLTFARARGGDDLWVERNRGGAVPPFQSGEREDSAERPAFLESV